MNPWLRAQVAFEQRLNALKRSPGVTREEARETGDGVLALAPPGGELLPLGVVYDAYREDDARWQGEGLFFELVTAMKASMDEYARQDCADTGQPGAFDWRHTSPTEWELDDGGLFTGVRITQLNVYGEAP